MTDALSDAQVLLLSALLLTACGAKVARAVRARSVSECLGPTVMFPLRLRGPAAVTVCAAEFVLGAGLLVTSGALAQVPVGTDARALRLAAGLLFLTATAALIQLRGRRPDVGCGCFGDLSTEPVSLRTIGRCAMLTVAAAVSVRAPAISLTDAAVARDVRVLPLAALAAAAAIVAELAVIAALSPELGGLIARLGHRAPCEARRVPPQRTLGVLRSSRTWRRYAGLLMSDEPADMWRELCWRYAVFPGWAPGGRKAEVVFAVHLRGRRPLVLAAVTDAATGEIIGTGGMPGTAPARLPAAAPQAAPVLAARVPQQHRADVTWLPTTV